jgi:thiol-disulfide isomerase/thioredoxin
MKILRFGADWCPACIIMRSTWSQVEASAPWLISEYYDYDEAVDKVTAYAVSDKLPTYIFVDSQSREILRLQGEFSTDKLLEIINEHKDR